MGVFDKIKNIFFEEEYVEVEEEKPKLKVAKKIELPEIRKPVEEKKVEIAEEEDYEDEIEEEETEDDDDYVSDRELLSGRDGFKFPMDFEEEDFKEDNYVEEPVVEERIEEVRTVTTRTVYEPEKLYTPYSGREEKKEKPAFKPTPIISPIYGILDKNYKKEEIVTKKEIRLTTATSRKMDVDAIREKAYGDLASEITDSMNEDKVIDEVEEYNNDLYELDNDEQPIVERVTVGDAEEYFNDLGLEYNIDYKDNSKEKATGRRSAKKKVEEEISEDVEETDEEQNDSSPLENNLFDLIDSMYDDREE